MRQRHSSHDALGVAGDLFSIGIAEKRDRSAAIYVAIDPSRAKHALKMLEKSHVAIPGDVGSVRPAKRQAGAPGIGDENRLYDGLAPDIGAERLPNSLKMRRPEAQQAV